MKLYLHDDGSVVAELSYSLYDFSYRQLGGQTLSDASAILKSMLKYINNIYILEDILRNELIFRIEGSSVVQVLQARAAIKYLFCLTETNTQIEIIYD